MGGEVVPPRSISVLPVEFMKNLYGHRHRWPYWNDQGAEKVVPRLAEAAVDWQDAHQRYAADTDDEQRGKLREAMLNLGVAAWWGLNQFSDAWFQPEQLDIAGHTEELHLSEDWPSSFEPLEAWRAVVVRRLSALFGQVADGAGDPEEAATVVRRQLLFIAFQTEQALARLLP